MDKEDKTLESNSEANIEKQSDENDGNCCSGPVTKFEQLDKSITPSTKIFHPLFFITHVSAFYNIDILYTSFVNTGIKYFVRSYHPPIPNIRVAIQSFQI